MDMHPVIGIVSYLPDDIVRRHTRYERLINLLLYLNAVSTLDYIIICQNYNKNEIVELQRTAARAQIYTYKKLGITPARQTLRTKFLHSKYSHLIMCDDDLVCIECSS